MAEFAYKNIKNINTNNPTFELNYSYHLKVFFKDNTNSCSKLKSANKLLTKLFELRSVCHKNRHYTKNF